MKLDDFVITERAAARANLSDFTASPGVSPLEWQTAAPPEAWRTRRMEVMPSLCLDRILALPRRQPPAPGSVESLAMIRFMTDRYKKVRTTPCTCAVMGKACITELWHIQAWTLYELGTYGSVFGLIGVGSGKTALDLLALSALAPFGARVGCLLIPPTLMLQLINDYKHIGQHFNLPSLQVHGKGETAWSHTVPGAPILHVFPYSRLQRAENTTWLETLSPDVIIADEADYLSNPETATASRVIRAIQKKPSTVFLPWSGSITSTSLKDYWHLIAFSFREKSPLPIVKDTIEDWARAIDPSDDPAPEGALSALYTRGGQTLHDAFHRRLVETHGVVHTIESSSSVPLRIMERQPGPLPDIICDALCRLREEWIRPDDMAPGHIEGAACEEFISALEVNACAVQLACGFFYRWKYPRGEPEALIRTWLNCRALWNKELRSRLKQRSEYMDSELLCKEAAMRHYGDLPKDVDKPAWNSEHWPRWRDIKDLVQPETESILLHDFLAQDAATWAQENRGIVWYESRAFGKRISDISGLPLHAGGANAGARILSERGDRSIIASLNSHGRGRDGLQHLFASQLVAQPPSNPTVWEQMLGRLLRPGQKAPEVTAYVYRHTDELVVHVERALQRAEYVRGTTGANQKLLTGGLCTQTIK